MAAFSLVAAETRAEKDATVLILGGGVSGVIAARTLHEKGIEDFIIVEARAELGGRMQNYTFGAPGREYTVELGPNWIQGTYQDGGPANPIYDLAKKVNLSAEYNDWFGSMTTYDYTGYNDYLDVFNNAVNAYENTTVVAGYRVDHQLVDTSLQTGYGLIHAQPKTPQEQASQYYQADWDAQTPAETSWIASSWSNNFTYNLFGDDNLMCIDQRGFKVIIQHEAAEFLQPEQTLLESVVETIEYDDDGVAVYLRDGRSLRGEYVLTTFSVGVLQYGDVVFRPALPEWKQEALESINMATYTKIFLQFEEYFWFDTQMALYADKTRGRYPVWQTLDYVGFLPGSGIVFVTVTGDFSVRIEGLTDAEVEAEVLGVLRAMYPGVEIPGPKAFYFPRWHSDPLFRGSYSNWPGSFVGGHAADVQARVGRVWFAGEGTSLRWFGFLHGAYFSGLGVATELARCIRGEGCDVLEHVHAVTGQRYPLNGSDIPLSGWW